MTDEDLRRQVAAELAWDPRVDRAAIEISAARGTITLAGVVPSLRMKLAAGLAAARVRGVIAVASEVLVRIPDRDRREDEDLRGDVREALMLDASVPMTVDAQARDALVTLTGTVRWHYQREAAESRTAEVTGVARIDNAITLTPALDARGTSDAIVAAFRRNAALDVDLLSVEVSPDGLVTVSGAVKSLAAHDQAIAAAWSAPGITQVNDRIRVTPEP